MELNEMNSFKIFMIFETKLHFFGKYFILRISSDFITFFYLPYLSVSERIRNWKKKPIFLIISIYIKEIDKNVSRAVFINIILIK